MDRDRSLYVDLSPTKKVFYLYASHLTIGMFGICHSMLKWDFKLMFQTRSMIGWRLNLVSINLKTFLRKVEWMDFEHLPPFPSYSQSSHVLSYCRCCEFEVFYKPQVNESLQAWISILECHIGEHSLHAANSSYHFLAVNILQFYMAHQLRLVSKIHNHLG